MKKIISFLMVLCVAFAAQAQNKLPYSKYLNFTKKEFKENKFKYDDETNTWALRKTNGLNTTLNILAIIADAEEDVRPDANDYAIVVQMGKEGKASYVKVRFYADETYHKLLTFIKDNGKEFVETSSGKLVKQQAYYENYAIELNMNRHIISRTSARTIDNKTVKNGETYQLAPTMKLFSGGDAIDASGVATYASSATAKATVSASGLVTGAADSGTATITVTVGTATDTMTVTCAAA